MSLRVDSGFFYKMYHDNQDIEVTYPNDDNMVENNEPKQGQC